MVNTNTDILNDQYTKIILDIANKKYPEIRKRTYSLSYYLNAFYLVLNDLVKWKSLKITKMVTSKYDNHWKSIENEFRKWSKDNIFKDAYVAFLQKNYNKMTSITKNKKINFFIDVVKFNNKYGSELVAINTEYKKKRVTELSCICDENKHIVSITPVDLVPTKKNKNKFVHKDELKIAQQTIDEIIINIPHYVDLNIAGDKGYISQNKYRIFGEEKQIITPKRKNQKTKNTKKELQTLTKRYKIENVFCGMKKFDRINVRKDKNISNFLSFVFMAILKIEIANISKLI